MPAAALLEQSLSHTMNITAGKAIAKRAVDTSKEPNKPEPKGINIAENQSTPKWYAKVSPEAVGRPSEKLSA